MDGAVRGTAWTAGALGTLFAKLQSGYVRFYAVVFVTGVICLLGKILALCGEPGGDQ